MNSNLENAFGKMGTGLFFFHVLTRKNATCPLFLSTSGKLEEIGQGLALKRTEAKKAILHSTFHWLQIGLNRGPLRSERRDFAELLEKSPKHRIY